MIHILCAVDTPTTHVPAETDMHNTHDTLIHDTHDMLHCQLFSHDTKQGSQCYRSNTVLVKKFWAHFPTAAWMFPQLGKPLALVSLKCLSNHVSGPNVPHPSAYAPPTTSNRKQTSRSSVLMLVCTINMRMRCDVVCVPYNVKTNIAHEP